MAAGATGAGNVPAYPFIPHPEPTVEALHETCVALKRAVEQLTGQNPAKNNRS